MKKILFTIQWYPSVLSANALCDQKIIEALSANKEYEITCLSYKPIGSLSEEKINRIKVIRFRKGLWWNIKVHAKSRNKKYSSIIIAIDKVILRIRQIITIPIYPILEPIASYTFAHKALRLYKKENFDMVISEFHGYDSLHAGSMIKKRYPKTIFIPILWDAFTGKQPARYLPEWYTNWRLQKVEKHELSCADKIVAMESSRKYHELYSIHKPYYDKYVYFDIPGIIKHTDSTLKSSLIHDEKINIVYAGILSLPDRDPEYIIRAVSQTSFASNIHFIFVCIGEGKQKVESIKKDCPCEITISGYIEKNELNALYQNADILLNLGGPNPNMVPSKVFEYLSYGKPILSTYYIDNEASYYYLSRYPLSICIDQRKHINESIRTLENEFHKKIGHSISFDIVRDLYKHNTPYKYTELIEQCFNR